MAKCCPKCGSTLAYIFTRWTVKFGKLYDLSTEEFIYKTGAERSMRPVKTYRVAECEYCGMRYRLDDEEYEKYKMR